MVTRRPAVPRTPATKRPVPSTQAARADDVRRAAGPDAKPSPGAKPSITPSARPSGEPPAGSGPAPTIEPNAKKAKVKGLRGAGRKAKASQSPAEAKTPLRTPVPSDDAPVPARAFSGRIVALAVVLVAITIMLAPTVRVFLGQRAEISALQADIAAKRSEQDSLKQSIARWEDENYVKQQARDRINMVMPGETAYWVFGDNGAGPAGTSSSGTSPTGGDKPWTQGFWDSLVRAATD